MHRPSFYDTPCRRPHSHWAVDGRVLVATVVLCALSGAYCSVILLRAIASAETLSSSTGPRGASGSCFCFKSGMTGREWVSRSMAVAGAAIVVVIFVLGWGHIDAEYGGGISSGKFRGRHIPCWAGGGVNDSAVAGPAKHHHAIAAAPAPHRGRGCGRIHTIFRFGDRLRRQRLKAGLEHLIPKHELIQNFFIV